MSQLIYIYTIYFDCYYSFSGLDGTPGKAGRGGLGAATGKTVKTKSLFLFIGSLDLECTEEDGEMHENGSDGKDDCNHQNLKFPSEPDPFVNQSLIINSYKNYVRENLPNHTRETKLREFLTFLDEERQIQMNYNPMDFVDELLGMEKQYFQLRHKLPYAPFVKSLLKRIVEYAGGEQDLSEQDKRILGFLHTAALAKLCSVQNRSKHISTVDLLKYLELIKEPIEELDKLERAVAINKYRKKFKASLDCKFKIANKLIETHIMPEIERMFPTINEQISKLIDEVIAKRETAINERKLRDSVIMQRILYWLQIFGLLTLCIGAAGVILGMLAEIYGFVAPVIGMYLLILKLIKAVVLDTLFFTFS